MSGHWMGEVRPCPACEHAHAVGTTCRECPTCRETDLVLVAERAFADLMPGGAVAIEATGCHNHNVGRYGACDGLCGDPDCRRPYLDASGLTRYGATALPPAPTPLVLPVEVDYPASAWEVDG